MTSWTSQKMLLSNMNVLEDKLKENVKGQVASKTLSLLLEFGA